MSTKGSKFDAVSRRQLVKGLTTAAIAFGSGLLVPPGAAIARNLSDTEPAINPFLGQWRYRSFRNVTDAATKLDDILFWEARLHIIANGVTHVTGDISDDHDKLKIRGYSTFGFPNYLRFEATGLDGTDTAGWKYNYTGFLVPEWPDGLDQHDAIVGSVIRSVAHSGGKAKAGYVASFVAVRMS